MKKSLNILVIVSIMLLSALPVFSQDEKTPEAVVPMPAPAVEAAQPKEIAIYGEVQAVDSASGTLSVQYYDYDSDSEKTADIAVNKDSKFENVSALSDVKKGDWADVTYSVADAKNVAKIVTVEKEEAPAEPAAGSAAADVPSDEY